MKPHRHHALAGAHVRRQRLRRTTRPGLLITAVVALAALGTLGALAAPSVQAQPLATITDPGATPSWYATLGGAAGQMDAARCVVMPGSGVILVGGELSVSASDTDATLSRYKGKLLQWTKTWDGGAHGWDLGYAVALSPDRKWVYQTGSTSRGNGDIFLLKRSVATGALKWARRYDGPGRKSDVGSTIGVDRKGNVIILGRTLKGSASNWVVVSYTPAGARRWAWFFDAKGANTWPYDLLVAADGTSYVTGDCWNAGATVDSAVTARISTTGKTLWLKKYPGPEGLGGTAFALAARPGGGVYAAGSMKRAATDWDGMVLVYRPTGTRTDFWPEAGQGGQSDEYFRDLTVTTQGYVVACGDSTPDLKMQARVTIYAGDGNPHERIAVPNASSETFGYAAADAFGGWYVTGICSTGSAGSHGVRVLRASTVENAGAWMSEWLPIGALQAEPIAVAVRDTSVCVVGGLDDGLNGWDQLVLTYTY